MRVSVAERSDSPHDFTQSAAATGNGIGNGAGIALIPRGCTEGCTPRAFAASPAGPARLTKPFPLGSEGRNGRYWARNRAEPDRPGLTWADFRPLFQGLLVDAKGRPISLSPTALHSALGQIRDMVAGSDELRRVAELLLRERTDQ